MAADRKHMESFILMLTTPISDMNATSDPQWERLSILPMVSSTLAVQYLQSSNFRSLFTILVYHLNELISNPSHEISSTSLICMELLLLGTGGNNLTPMLPALLSNLVVMLRTNSLMTWREKSLTIFIFAHALSTVAAPAVKSFTPSVSQMVADWLEMATHSTVANKVELQPRQEGESLSDYQARRVQSELAKQVPPLLQVLLECSASETHINVTVITMHACFLLIRPAITFFPDSVLLIIDRMISLLLSPSTLLSSVSNLLSHAMLTEILDNDSLTNKLLLHIAQLMHSLPSFLLQHDSQAGLLALSQLRGYCSILGDQFVSVFSMEGDELMQLQTWYETVKDILNVKSITTVGVDLADEQHDSAYFRVIYENLDTACSQEMWKWVYDIVNVFRDDWLNEISLWLMNDCLDDSREAALLFPIIVKRDQKQLTLSQSEMIDSLLGGLKSVNNYNKKNASFILHSILVILFATDSFSQFQSQLLSLLFFYKAVSTESGVISSCFHMILSFTHAPSLSYLVLDNYDYLLDSTLLQIRLASSMSFPTLSPLLSVLESLWSFLLQSTITDSLFPFIRDSVNVCRELLHRFQSEALQTLLPLTCCLVQLINESGFVMKRVESESIELIVDRYLENKLRTLLPLQSVDLSKSNPTQDGDDNNSKQDVSKLWEDEEKPDERLGLVTSILKDIRYFLQTDEVALQIHSIRILSEVCRLRDSERKKSLLLPLVPSLAVLLRSSNNSLFLSSLSTVMDIISIDSQSIVMQMKEKIWPELKAKLYGCIQARQDDFSQIQSVEVANKLEKEICENITRVYTDSIIFGDVCVELLQWINERSMEGSIPDYCEQLLNKVSRFNFDVVAQVLMDLNPEEYAAVVRKQSRGCIRYRKEVNIQHKQVDSLFVQSLIHSISSLVCLTSCHSFSMLSIVPLCLISFFIHCIIILCGDYCDSKCVNKRKE